MPASVLSVRVDSDIKASFSDLCDELGLSPSAAVNVFIRQMLREKSFPFVPSTVGGSTASPVPILSVAQIARKVEAVASNHPEIASVVLFGSYARGDANEKSDIDLRLNVEDGSKMGAIALASLAEELRQALDRPIDLVSAKNLRPDLELAIAREGVVLYERS